MAMTADELAEYKRAHMRRKRSDPKYRQLERVRAHINKLEREWPLLAGYHRARDKKAFFRQATALWRNAR